MFMMVLSSVYHGVKNKDDRAPVYDYWNEISDYKDDDDDDNDDDDDDAHVITIRERCKKKREKN